MYREGQCDKNIMRSISAWILYNEISQCGYQVILYFGLILQNFFCIITMKRWWHRMSKKMTEKKEYGIGKRIHEYRVLSGYTQKQLADMIGVSNGRVSNWEQGINRPDAD